MNKYKLLSFAFLILLIMGCKFPDNVPKIEELEAYKLDTLMFGKTTVKSFKSVTKAGAGSLSGDALIFDSTIADDKYFNKARLGFRDNKLSWIEFYFSAKVSASEILKLYGKPTGINKNYSKKFDYYEYGEFSLSLPKEKEYFVALNLFDLPYKSLKNKTDIPKNENPDINFDSLEAGKTLESDFRSLYPTLEPSFLSPNTTEYLLKGSLSPNPLIKQISLKFSGSLLNWVTVTPFVPLSADSLTVLKDQTFTVEKKQKYDFYIYKNVILTVSKDKKIINIGILDGKISSFLKFKKNYP